jgi:hypothetical protein
MQLFHHGQEGKDSQESSSADEASLEGVEQVSDPEAVLNDSEIFVPRPGTFEDGI